jgi:hypothetical protein
VRVHLAFFADCESACRAKGDYPSRDYLDDESEISARINSSRFKHEAGVRRARHNVHSNKRTRAHRSQFANYFISRDASQLSALNVY